MLIYKGNLMRKLESHLKVLSFISTTTYFGTFVPSWGEQVPNLKSAGI